MSLLRAENVSIAFGGVVAVDGVSLAIDQGEFVGLIGPNGAGKTTLLRLLTGQLRPNNGSVWIDEHNVTKASVHMRARAGLVTTHQIVRLAFQSKFLWAIGQGAPPSYRLGGCAAQANRPVVEHRGQSTSSPDSRVLGPCVLQALDAVLPLLRTLCAF